MSVKQEEIRQAVRKAYGEVAQAGAGCGCSCGCGTGENPTPEDVSIVLGYSSGVGFKMQRSVSR